MIVFDENGNWHGKGAVPGSLKYQELSRQWLKSFVKEIQDIGSDYSAAIANDGHLVGMEKIGLLQQLEDVLGGIFWFYRMVLPGKPMGFSSLQASKTNRFSVDFDGYTWRALGCHQLNSELGNFRDWFNLRLLPLLGRLIETYGDGIADAELSPDEVDDIALALNRLVQEILLCEFSLTWRELSG